MHETARLLGGGEQSGGGRECASDSFEAWLVREVSRQRACDLQLYGTGANQPPYALASSLTLSEARAWARAELETCSLLPVCLLLEHHH